MLFLHLIVALLAQPARAQWLSAEDAPVILEKEAYKLFVHSDGSYDGEDRLQFTIQKEAGIEQMMLQRFFYDPNVEFISITKASVTDGTSENQVDLKTIEDKALASEGPGLRSHHQVSIPMPRMQVGSKVEIILAVNGKKPFVPGYFFYEEKFGQSYYERAHELEIESELPLHAASSDSSQLLSVSQGKRNGHDLISVSLRSPSSRILIGEPQPLLTDDLFPRVEISSFDKWSDVVSAFGPTMEKEYLKPLPPKLQEIADRAISSKESKLKMAEAVTRGLISQIKYLGDWRLEQNYYLPRPLAEIESSGRGDCKDFALATSALLRKVGINAWVAWVDRTSTLMEQPLGKPLLPSYNHFNHAIVYAEIENKTYWIDATNPSANVEIPYLDIADRPALIFKPGTYALAYIPSALLAASSADIYEYLAFRYNGKVDGMSRVTLMGSPAVEMDRLISLMPESLRQYALLESSVPGGRVKFLKLPYEKSDAAFSSDPSKKRVTFSYELIELMKKTSLGYVLSVPVPRSLQIFKMTAAGRSTGVRTGGPFTSHRKMVLSHFGVGGALPKGCNLNSRWLGASRAYSASSDGVIIDDKVEAKVPALTISELVSPEFESLQKQIDECFGEALLAFQYLPAGSKKASLHNEIMNETGDLGKAAIELSNASENEKGYGNKQYAKMMLHEALAMDPKNAKNWGRMGNITQELGYEHDDVFDQTYIAEALELAKKAQSLNEAEFNSNMLLFTHSLADGNYSDADRRYAVIKKTNPEVIPDFELKILGNKMRRGIDVRGNAMKAINLLITRIKQAKPGEDLSGKYEYLGDLYLKLNQREYAETSYRRGIEISKHPAWPQLNFSSYLSRQMRFAEAEEYARASLKSGETGMGHKMLAIALAGKAYESYNHAAGSESYGEAIRLCEEALQHDNANERCVGLVDSLKSRISSYAKMRAGPNPEMAERNIQLEENAMRFPMANIMKHRPNAGGLQPAGAQANQPPAQAQQPVQPDKK